VTRSRCTGTCGTSDLTPRLKPVLAFRVTRVRVHRDDGDDTFERTRTVSHTHASLYHTRTSWYRYYLSSLRRRRRRRRRGVSFKVFDRIFKRISHNIIRSSWSALGPRDEYNVARRWKDVRTPNRTGKV